MGMGDFILLHVGVVSVWTKVVDCAGKVEREKGYIVDTNGCTNMSKAPHCPERTRAATQPTMTGERLLVARIEKCI
jgi:hypothetical protein